MAVEVDEAIKRARAILLADGVIAASGVKVWSAEVPQGAAFPRIVLFAADARDTRALGNNRAFVTAMVGAKVIGREGGYDAIRPLADRVDDVLEGRTGFAGSSSGGFWVGKFVRDSSIRMDEVDEKVQYFHLGGLYGVMAHQG